MTTESTLSSATSPSAAPERSRSSAGNGLYTAMGLALIVLILLAFSTRYFVRPADAPALPLFVHVHALLFIGWVCLFTAQAFLAQRGHFGYHRQIGTGAVVIAALIVIVGFYTAIEGARRGHNPGGAPNALAFMIVPWMDITLFGGFFFAAWHFRKRQELHKRLMLFATFGGFLAPTVVRLPLLPDGPQRVSYLFAISLLVLLIPAATNWLRRRRVHWLDWVGALVIFASLPLRFLVGATETWQRFATWMIG